MDGALAHALKYVPERRAQSALCREKDRERETRERERERERRKESRVLWTARSRALCREREREGKRAGRARSCAMDGPLARALKYARERRAQSALCREKDRKRET